MELQPIELDIDDGTEVAYDQVLREIFEGYFTREGRATKHVILFLFSQVNYLPEGQVTTQIIVRDTYSQHSK